MIYVDALKKVGKPDDHMAIGEALGETDKETAMGRIVFDPETHLPPRGRLCAAAILSVAGRAIASCCRRRNSRLAAFQPPPWMTK